VDTDPLLPVLQRLGPELGEGVELVDQRIVEEPVGDRLGAVLQLLDLFLERVALVGRRLGNRPDEVEVELDLEFLDFEVDALQFFFKVTPASLPLPSGPAGRNPGRWWALPAI